MAVQVYKNAVKGWSFTYDTLTVTVLGMKGFISQPFMQLILVGWVEKKIQSFRACLWI